MNNARKTEPDSRMLERPRTLDYVTRQGLSTLTGCDATDLDIFCLKEIVDNALDACTDIRPDISIVMNTHDFLTLSVTDNGRGLPQSHISKISDYDRLYSTKHHNKIPTRGELGQALKVIMGIPYALAEEKNIHYPNPPILIRSRGKEHKIVLRINRGTGDVKARVETENAIDTETLKGTEVAITLPIIRKNWGWRHDYIHLLRGYALFNPEASFHITLNHNDHNPYVIGYSSIGGKEKSYSGRSSVHWFSEAEFKHLIWAILREEDEETITDFIYSFRGLSNYEKIKEVIHESQIEHSFQYILELAEQDDLTERLYNSMRKNSKKPKPEVLGRIGEEQIRGRLLQIYGGLTEFSYKKNSGIYDDGTVQIPYVIEVGIGVLADSEKEVKTEIFSGINHSPCMYGNPFDRCWLEWTQRGEEKREYGVRGLLKNYGVGDDEPVVVAMHLISPGVEYINYGKSEINTEPFQRPLAQTLYRTCKFYHHYKRGGNRRRVGQKSLARRLLVRELNRRAELRLRGPIPRSERTTQQGLYYKIRKAMGGKTDISRDSFTSAILGECRSMGRKRAELGIFAAVRSEMYFRGQVYQVSWENIKDLAQKGSDVILIEKEGISLALAPYAEKRGVALVNSRGFIVDYAKDLLALSRTYKANLFQITDLDDSGLLISSQISEIPRIGIDLRTLNQLDLTYEEVAEEYNPKKHIKALTEPQRRLVAKKRIEIDSILAEVGPERIWNHIEERMLELAPTRDLTRSIDLSVELPPKISEPLNIITNWIKSIGHPKQAALIKWLENWDMGFTDTDDMEKKLQSDIVDVIEEDIRTEEVSKALHNIIDKIRK